MKTLVTGATGFIGNHVIRELIAKGVEVVATSSDEKKASAFPWYRDVTYHPLRFENLDPNNDYARYFGNPGRIIHLAWEGLPNYKSLFHLEENLFRHYFFLKNLARNGVQDMTVTGTCFEYGMQEGCLKEDLCTRPANPYGIAKDTLRKFLEQLAVEIPFDLKWVRLFYLYGSGQHPKSILSQLQRAIDENQPVFNMSEGNQQRDYLPVEKAAEYIVKIAMQKTVKGIINCCSGKPVTIKQLVQDFLNTTGQNIKLNPGYYPYPDYEPMNFWGDNKTLTSILNHE